MSDLDLAILMYAETIAGQTLAKKLFLHGTLVYDSTDVEGTRKIRVRLLEKIGRSDLTLMKEIE